jgi:ubiquinone/menaquinone biosynthesis C-methylase UbiE
MSESTDVMQAVAPVFNTVGPSFFDYFADRVIEILRPGPDDLVLDLGSGPGTLLDRLRQRDRERVPKYVAIDASRRMLRQITRSEGDRTCRVQCDAVQLGIRTDSIDQVVCSFAITMFTCARCATAEVHRILRPGGTAAFVSVSAARDYLWGWQDDLLRRYGVEVPPRASRRFRRAQDYEDLLAGRFAAVRVQEAFAPLHYRDSDEWIAWCASHGGRAFLRQIPAGRRKAFARDVADVLRRYTGPDGIDLILPALVVLADK